MDILHRLEKEILSADKLESDGVPSASIAILDNGRVSAHVITNGKEDIDTVYQACSISKAIVGLAVARLIDQGRISYDTKVVNHLPQSAIDCLVDVKTAHLLQHVTVGMLLSHTSGLSQGGFEGYPNHPPDVETVLAGRQGSNTPKIHFLTLPGAQFSYSGGGFTVLQLVLENVTGRTIQQLMQDLVLKPLDMTRSWYGNLPPSEQNYTSAGVTGYTKCEPSHHNFIELAAAGLWTTPTDLLKTVVAVQDSLYTSTGFLTTVTARAMLAPLSLDTGLYHGTNELVAGRCIGGWQGNSMTFAHSGQNFPGYTSLLLGFIPGGTGPGNEQTTHAMHRSGIAIMTNSLIGHNVCINQLVSAVFHLKGWPRYRHLSAGFREENWVPYAASEATVVDAEWREWKGSWDPAWRIVESEDGGPAVGYKDFPPMRLRSAAVGAAAGDDKKELMFVVDGIDVGVRFTWQGEERVVEVMQKEVLTLRRS